MSKFSPRQLYQELNGKYQELTKAPLISDFIAALLILLVSVIFNTVFPSLSTAALGISSLIALITFAVFFRFKKSWALAGIIALVFLGVLSLMFGPKSAPRGGAYIIFDYSENMQEVLKGTNVSNLISLAAAQIPDNIDMGLMLSGDPITGDVDECHRVNEVLPPAPKLEGLNRITNSIAYLDSFVPQGRGNIEHAIFQAINNLAGREDVQEIIVITSGVDERCEPLNRTLLDLAAGTIKIKYSLTILTVGPQTEESEQKLRLFAHKYKGTALADDIPSSVETIVEEPIFSYYSP